MWTQVKINLHVKSAFVSVRVHVLDNKLGNRDKFAIVHNIILYFSKIYRECWVCSILYQNLTTIQNIHITFWIPTFSNFISAYLSGSATLLSGFRVAQFLVFQVILPKVLFLFSPFFVLAMVLAVCFRLMNLNIHVYIIFRLFLTQ